MRWKHWKDQDNGEISLTVKQPGTTTLIEVTDNGPGIPHDMLEDIFIPFFTTKNKGTGIGLSLSRQIVRMHGGELPGQFTTLLRNTFHSLTA